MIKTLRCWRRPSAASRISRDARNTRLSGLVLRNALCNNSSEYEAKATPLFRQLRSLTSSRPMASATTPSNPSSVSTVPLDLTADGVTTRIHIKPSYIHKPKAVENLLKNLPTLLTDAVMPATAIDSFSTKGWDLDEASDTIHRYITVAPGQVAQIMEAIKAASKAENHDPHIHVDGSHMTISCTTHVPPGLSMKDVKLAKAINEILDVNNVEHEYDSDVSEADILTYRQRGREHNMEAVRQAKLACSCG